MGCAVIRALQGLLCLLFSSWAIGAETLTVIDSGVTDAERIVERAQNLGEVLVLRPERDPMAQILESLQKSSPIKALHIVAHARPGELYLADTAYRLIAERSPIHLLAEHLAPGADVLLYGCELAKGDVGRAFIQSLSQALDADVAASQSPIGSSSLGGDWLLEAKVGQIEAQALRVDDWPGLLSTDTDGDGVSDDVDRDDDNDGLLDATECDFSVDIGADGTFESFADVALNHSANFILDGHGWTDTSAPTFSPSTWSSPVAPSTVFAAGLPETPEGTVFAAGVVRNRLEDGVWSVGASSFATQVSGLVANVDYKLSFYQANAGSTSPIQGAADPSLTKTPVGSKARWKVYFAGTSQLSPEQAYLGEGLQTWERVDLVFTALSSTHELRFEADGGSDGTDPISYTDIEDGEDLTTDRLEYMAIDRITLVPDDAQNTEPLTPQFLQLINNCNTDRDGDGIIDPKDLDSDNDGIPDNIEAQTSAGYIAPTGFTDMDADGLNDVYESAPFTNDSGISPVDSDQDGEPDIWDLDSDGDGQWDIDESGQSLSDSNNDGRVDALVGTNGVAAGAEASDDYSDVNALAFDDGTSHFQLADSDSDAGSDGAGAAPPERDFDYRDTQYDDQNAPWLTLSHDGVGVRYCPETFFVDATDASGALNVDYQGTIGLALDAMNGDWSVLGSGVSTIDGNWLLYTFAPEDRGRAAFSWAYKGSANAWTPQVIAHNPSQATQVQPIQAMEYTDRGLEFSLPDRPLVTKQNEPVVMTMMQGDSGACSTDTSYSGIIQYNVKRTYINPSSGSRSAHFYGQINGSNNASSISGNSDTGTYRIQVQNGVGDFAVKSKEAGLISFEFTDPNNPASKGSFQAWWRPEQLMLSVDSELVPAGEQFTVKLTATTVNNDNSFTRIQPAPTATLAEPVLVTPNIGDGAVKGILTNPELTAEDTNDGNNTLAQTEVSYSESGTVKLEIESLTGPPGSGISDLELWRGDDGKNLEVQVNFRAATLKTQIETPGMLESECSGFAYVGQKLTWMQRPKLLVQGLNADGNVLQNYGLLNNPFDLNDSTRVLLAEQTSSTQLGRNGLPLLVERDDVALMEGDPRRIQESASLSYELHGEFSFVRDLNAEVAPFNPEIRTELQTLIDQNGASAPINATSPLPIVGYGVPLRFGRIQLSPQRSPWMRARPITVHPSYYNGSTYVVSTDDDCSEITRLTFTDVDGQDSYAFDSDWVSNSVNPAPGSARTLTSADQGHLFYDIHHTWRAEFATTPSAQVLVKADVPEYLRYPWQTPSTWENPTALQVFGVYAPVEHEFLILELQ